MPKVFDPEAEASKEMHSAFQTLLGGLGWVTLTRYDISIFVCCLQRVTHAPRMKHLENANKLLKWTQRNTLVCHYRPFSGDRRIRVQAVSDSAFKKEDHEGLAMRGAVIGITTLTSSDSDPGGIFHVIEHYSRKQKRVVRSTFAAELHALIDAIEHGKLIMFALTEILCGGQSA